MRKFISILLLTSYMAGILGPALPLADYLLRYDYYANVLCENRDKPALKCNGTCKLAQLMKEAEQAANPAEMPATLEAPLLLVMHVPARKVCPPPYVEEEKVASVFADVHEAIQDQWISSPPVPPPWL